MMSHTVYRTPYHDTVVALPSMRRPAVRPDRAVRPNYLVRRLMAVAVIFVVLLVALAFLVLLAGLGGRPASASQAEPAHFSATRSAVAYVAGPGDTLWSVASARHGSAPLDAYLDALIDLNGGTTVQVGQVVHLP